jgi:hypothetical protein
MDDERERKRLILISIRLVEKIFQSGACPRGFRRGL